MTVVREDRAEFERRVISPGWVEYRCVVPNPDVNDQREYAERGEPARWAMIKWMLAYSSGIATSYGWFYLDSQLHDLWKSIEAKIPGKTTIQ